MATQETTALVSVAPSFVVSADEIKARIEELQRFVGAYMVAGEDYGTIPGTQKPTLYKPGAEKLCDVYGFTKEFVVVESLEDWDRGRFAYTVKATLRSKRTNLLEAEGLGSCNSMEAKYRWLWVWDDKLPPHLDKASLVSKRTKKGAVQYRVPNDDPYSQVNTILKMAKKRALVDAVLSATRSSGLFTQDLEDLKANGVLGDEEGVDTPYLKAEPAKPKPSTPKADAPKPLPYPERYAKLWDTAQTLGITKDTWLSTVHSVVGDKKHPTWTPDDWHAVLDALNDLLIGSAPPVDELPTESAS